LGRCGVAAHVIYDCIYKYTEIAEVYNYYLKVL